MGSITAAAIPEEPEKQGCLSRTFEVSMFQFFLPRDSFHKQMTP
jgi:hypothetical protein